MMCLACSLLGGCSRAQEAGAEAIQGGFGCDHRKLANPLVLDAREEAMDRFGLSAVEGLLKTRMSKKETKELMSEEINIKADIEDLIDDGSGYDEVHKHLMSAKADEGTGRKYRMFSLRDHALDLGMENSEAMDGRRKPLIDFIAGHYCGEGGGGTEEAEPEKKPKRSRGGRRKKAADPEPEATEEPTKKRRGRRRKKADPEPEPEPEAPETTEEPEPEPEKPKKKRGRRKKAEPKDEPTDGETDNSVAGIDLSEVTERLDAMIDLVNNSGSAVDKNSEAVEELKGELADMADVIEGVNDNVKAISALLQYKMGEEDFEDDEIKKVVKEAVGN